MDKFNKRDFSNDYRHLYHGRESYPPFYSNNADYNTNAKSYYDDLGRKAKLFEELANRIWYYDEELAKRFEEWDKLIEHFPEDVKALLEKWLKDGTLSDIINKNIFKDLNELIEALSERVTQNESDIRYLKKFERKSNKMLHQTLMMNLDVGSDESPLFEGSQKANQGIAYVKHNDKEYIFAKHRVKDSGWSENELSRITQYELSEDGAKHRPIAISENLKIGHQGLSAYVDSENKIILIAAEPKNKGYSKIEWVGEKTCQKNVKSYQLIKDNGDSDRFSIFYHATPAVDKYGEFLVLSCATHFDSPLRYALIYNLNEIQCATNPSDVKPLYNFRITPPPCKNGNVVQDLALDDGYIYVLTGYNEFDDAMFISSYGFDGGFIEYAKVDLAKNKYTSEDAITKEIKIEPEGLTIREHNLIAQCVCDIKADCCKELNRYVYEISSSVLNSRSEPLNSVSVFDPASNIHLHGNGNDISLNMGDAFQVSYYDFPTEQFRDIISYTKQHYFSIYDNRKLDLTNVEDERQHIVIAPYYNEDEQYAIIRSDRSNNFGAGINLKTTKAPGGSSITFIAPKDENGNDYRLYLSGDKGHFRPGTDSEQDIGSSGYKWNNLYANNLQTTSDRDKKENISNTDIGLDFIEKLNPVKYNLKDDKNKEVRYGLIAQDIEKIAKELNINFDACKYEVDIDEETGKEIKTYTLGYNDLFAPIIKSIQELNNEIKELKNKIGD